MKQEKSSSMNGVNAPRFGSRFSVPEDWRYDWAFALCPTIHEWTEIRPSHCVSLLFEDCQCRVPAISTASGLLILSQDKPWSDECLEFVRSVTSQVFSMLF